MVTCLLTLPGNKIVQKALLQCLFFFLFFYLTTFTCPAQTSADYSLVLQNGIWVEHFNSTLIKENRYTENNHLFKQGRRFTYRYYYLDKDGNKYLQKVDPKLSLDREKGWKLVPLSEKDSLTNDRLQLIVETDLQGVDAQTPGANHTPFRWEYFAPAGQLHFLERSSLVENRKNIWMQPPHARMFRILALNPFPFIQAPFQVGNIWVWRQVVAPHWSDLRWAEWKNPLTSHYSYTISREETIATAFGFLKCLVVEAEGRSTLGSTFLTLHYNTNYGFLKLQYLNIDGSRLLMELTGIKD
ncbi:hypothetical protein D770_16590 [Flammeovirgaceae bacterium 311]|nr:hypothetical protein D770_16590 [Flammeovirgaceae bacterium 311]